MQKEDQSLMIKTDLKSDLNLIRIVWNEIGLSCTPKFHALNEHSSDILHKLRGFYDMGEDSIERWHQIRLRCHHRIRHLRSIEKQKENQAKQQEVQNDQSIKDAIDDVEMNCNRKFEKKHNFKSNFNCR